MNQETIDLYKREKMSPFSGCLSGIVQIVADFFIVFCCLIDIGNITNFKTIENKIIHLVVA